MSAGGCAFDEAIEVLEGLPLDADAVAGEVVLPVAPREATQRRHGAAAVAADLGRHALSDLAGAARIDEPQLVGVRVDVDETRR